MTRAASLYLDLVRLVAALTVFFAHYASQLLTGGLFWQLQDYGHLAVIAFFVLSGMVIAYSADAKDRTLHAYCVSRLSRLYSVVGPAILLTVVVDAIGIRLAPQLYTEAWGFDASEPLLRIALALTFTSYIWFMEFQVFSMGPFWSLPYEFWYYVFFGSIYFLPGRVRWVGAVVVMLIAGPRILFLLPIWLMGVVAYLYMNFFSRRRWLGWVSFGAPLLVFLLCQYLDARGRSRLFTESILGPDATKLWFAAGWSPYDYLFGVLVAFNIVGFQAVSATFIGFLEPLKSMIRWAAGLTFSLYLFHMPLLQFYTAISPWPISDWRHRVFLALVTLVSIAVLGSITERRRGVLRDWLANVLPDGNRWTIMGREGSMVQRRPNPASGRDRRLASV